MSLVGYLMRRLPDVRRYRMRRLFRGFPHDPRRPDALLEPVSNDDDNHGAGVSLRYDPVYQQIRDARRHDDATLPMGESWLATVSGNFGSGRSSFPTTLTFPSAVSRSI